MAQVMPRFPRDKRDQAGGSIICFSLAGSSSQAFFISPAGVKNTMRFAITIVPAMK